MGLNKKQWYFTEKHFKFLFKENYVGKKILELGCQEVKYNLLREFERSGIIEKKKMNRSMAAKDFFERLGFSVVSVDIEECFSSIYMDLRKPIPCNFVNKFDVVTNYGTTEHVWPKKYQFQVFKNIHDCLKRGGVFIHTVPGFKSKSSHCRINYGEYFFPMLAKMNNYKIIEINNELNKDASLCHIAVCMIKLADNLFFKDEKEFFKHIIKLSIKTVRKYKKREIKNIAKINKK